MAILANILPDWLRDAGTFSGFYAQMLYLIPLLPLVGFLINAMARKSISKEGAGAVATLASFAAFIWSLLCFIAMTQQPDSMREFVKDPASAHYSGGFDFVPHALHYVYATWISVGSFDCSFGLLMDQLSGVMCLVVTGVGTLIHLYSIGYMAHDESAPRFFAYLNLFLFSMLLLVLGDNLVMLFVGWEGVGLCSYLLIGFWYKHGPNADAGMKAFLFNRVGDLGFLLGMFILFATFGTLNYVAQPQSFVTGGQSLKAEVKNRTEIGVDGEETMVAVVTLPKEAGLMDYAQGLKNLGGKRGQLDLGYKAAEGNFDLSNTLGGKIEAFSGYSINAMIALACLLLFVGAMGKSAQLPLYAWLPDAMAGPTPVSALIHAATMVTAGVYMVTRLHPMFLFSETVLTVIAFIGALTAIFAALCGLTQTDIKKVLAYSTVSQLGYMFLGAGVGAFGLAMFHVVTHAFFKALLFLGSGSVIHGMSDEQDMRKMGGLRHKMPITFWTMLAGSVALAGVPFTAGWYSKDQILGHVLAKAHATDSTMLYVLYGMALIGAFCTAFYTFRLIGMTFFGECRADEKTKSHIHESPPVMTLPLIVLAVFALIGGWWLNSSFGGHGSNFLGIAEVAYDTHHGHTLNVILAGVAAFGGIGLACMMYIGKTTLPPEDDKQGLFYRLSKNRFYVEAFYDQVVTGTFVIFAEVLHLFVDVLLIDTIMVSGIGALTRGVGGVIRRLQTGVVNAYATGILIGALVVLFKLLSG